MAKKQSRTKQTPQKKTALDWADRFLDRLSQVGVICHAARLAIVPRSEVYKRRDADPEFAAAMADAIEAHTQAMEQEMIRRAVEGTERPVFHQGLECGRIREYSDTLLIFALKSRRPDVYRDNVRHEHTGRVQHSHKVEDLSDDELARIASQGQPG